jgi:hypothetical protein
VLHVLRPRDYDVRTPVLFVHHGVARNGRGYGDYWLNLVDKAGILAISIEFPEASFPEHLWHHFGNLHDKDGTPNRCEEWTFGIDKRLFDLLRAHGVTTGNTMDCSATPRLGNSCTEWSRSVSATASP